MGKWWTVTFLAAAVIALGMEAPARADIANFFEWTLVEDPPNDNFTSSVDSASQITLRATAGPITGSTDIGYQSINGADVLNATQGWAFNPSTSFSVALDYNLSFGAADGGFSIGLGIGEDRDGSDSAGIVLTSQDGSSFAVGGAARINDVTQLPVILGAGQSTGRFLVGYDAVRVREFIRSIVDKYVCNDVRGLGVNYRKFIN